VQTYLAAFQATGKPRYASVARDTLDYLLRDMRHPEGGFYSAEVGHAAHSAIVCSGCPQTWECPRQTCDALGVPLWGGVNWGAEGRGGEGFNMLAFWKKKGGGIDLLSPVI